MTLGVYVHATLVGTIDRRAGVTVFRFDRNYLDLSERPVLGRWFEDRVDPSFQLEERGSKLPPFFQNYLPEEHSALRVLLAHRAGVRPNMEFALLRALGEDLPGAIAVRSPSEAWYEPEARRVFASGDPEVAAATPLRFSLAGMQLKFSVLQHEKRFTLPLTGQGGRWIAKLPDQRFPGVPQNEHAMLTWAREVGIDVPEFRLVGIDTIDGLPSELRFREREALVIRRFDRGDDGARVHQEDFAQVLNVRPKHKYNRFSYATVANIVRTICGESDFEELVRRLVFAVLSGNADAHLKNWSLTYPDGRKPRLSPAYDLVCTVAYGDVIDRNLGLQLSGEKRFDAIGPQHFALLAERIGANTEKTVEIALETAARARDVWRDIRSVLPLADDARRGVDEHLASVKV